MEQEVGVHRATVMRDADKADPNQEPSEVRSVRRVGAKKKADAVESLLDGHPETLAQVAADVGVDVSKVNSWLEVYRDGGRQALRSDHVETDDELGAIMADLYDVVKQRVMDEIKSAV